MEIRRLTALLVSLVAAALIIFAGKSCMDDAIQKKKESLYATTSPYGPTPPTVSPTVPYTDPAESSTAEDTSEEREYVTVTNIFGDVVEVIPVTTPEEANMPTTTLSILDEYNADKTTVAEEEITTAPISIPDGDDLIIHIH